MAISTITGMIMTISMMITTWTNSEHGQRHAGGGHRRHRVR
jgi:hypothetical protein